MEERKYLLLTSRLHRTTSKVKNSVIEEYSCFEKKFKSMTQYMRDRILKIATIATEDYTVIPIQGSGTFAMEGVIGTVIGEDDKVFVISNGLNGDRIGKICGRLKVKYTMYKGSNNEVLDFKNIEEILKNNSDITYIALAHCETSSGILNSLEKISELAEKYKKKLILDATVTFGGYEFDIAKYGVDFLIGTPNECLQGLPGFSFVIARLDVLRKRKNKIPFYSLDIYDQWQYMEKTNGLWRFTPPTHIIKAFEVALDELEKEGGVKEREKRYKINSKFLKTGMKKLGFKCLVQEENQSIFLTSFIFPEDKEYNFEKIYKELKNRGYIVDRDELLEKKILRIGTVGDISNLEIEKFLEVLEKLLKNFK